MESEDNERADEVAKAAADMDGPNTASYAHLRRMAKADALRFWTRDWEETPIGGLYAFAKHGPPAHKPPSHFYDLPRRLYGLITQARLGHAFIGEYYRRFVPSEDTECPCGAYFQTRSHILQDCACYSAHHYILCKVSRDIAPQLVLGKPEGIATLAHFIDKTGAFTKTGDTIVS